MATDAPFDAEDHVWRYRFAHETGNAEQTAALRRGWAEWQGEDSLHEMAYGEPIDVAAPTDRVYTLSKMMSSTIDRNKVAAIQKEAEWVVRIDTGESAVPSPALMQIVRESAMPRFGR